MPAIVTAMMADWSTHTPDEYYYDYEREVYIQLSSANPEFSTNTYREYTTNTIVDAYRAVTVGIPKNFDDALVHPVWGDPARAEFNTIKETGTIIRVDTTIAKEALKNGATLVVLFPVYEEKIKDGQTVKKVRLVGDGRTHYDPGSTYTTMPSKEELYLLLHLTAHLNWHYILLDEKRAFLGAPRNPDSAPVYTKLKNVDDMYFKVLNALYGLKDACRDYDDKSSKVLESHGFQRLLMCSPIFVKHIDAKRVIIILKHVDDNVIFGNCLTSLNEFVHQLRLEIHTTEPEHDAPMVLGIALKRDKPNRLIKLTMTSKIEDLAKLTGQTDTKQHRLPIPQWGYVITDEEYARLPADHQVFLPKKQILHLMTILGSLIWISNVRLDILFANMYVSWHTKQPRQHHLNMAYRIINYLYNSRHLPLVLGGTDPIRIHNWTDSSLGTAPKRRSVLAHVSKLSSTSGAIAAKCNASSLTHMASFTSELDGLTVSMKAIRYLINICEELSVDEEKPAMAYTDNEAMMYFVKGEGKASGVRHMELRLWYSREQYKSGKVDLQYWSGTDILPDQLTKVGTNDQFRTFVYNLMGLSLLNWDKDKFQVNIEQ